MADFFTKIMCCYCQQEILDIRVKCLDCTDFYICIECFRCGAEIGNHRSYHRYQLDNIDSSPLCGSQGWTAREEFLLLDAIEQYGYGNWEDISEHIETRNAEDALTEYISRYIEGNIGRLTWNAAASNKPDIGRQVKPDIGPLSPSITSSLPPLNVNPDDAKLLGYMPQRDDFEREHDNTAEDLVSQLFINSLDDDELDIAMKLAQVDMYTRRLRERARRRRISRDYQLVSQFFSATRKERPSKKRISKEEKEFRDRMRPIARFYTAHEHEKFLQNLQKEREMKLRLSELSKYRLYGITHHEECPYFEQELTYHEEVKEKKPGSSGSCPSPPPLLPRKREKNDVAPSFLDPKSILRNEGKFSHDEDVGELSGETEISADTPTSSCYHLLTPNEVKLCSSLNMKPTQYMNQKTYMFQDYYSKKKDNETLSGTETPIFNYMMTSGWITAI